MTAIRTWSVNACLVGGLREQYLLSKDNIDVKKFSHSCNILAAALGEFLPDVEVFSFVLVSRTCLATLLGQPLEQVPEWLMLEMLYWAAWGKVRRLRGEILKCMEEIAPVKARWKKNYRN